MIEGLLHPRVETQALVEVDRIGIVVRVPFIPVVVDDSPFGGGFAVERGPREGFEIIKKKTVALRRGMPVHDKR